VRTLQTNDVVERAYALTDVVDPDPTHFLNNLAAVVDSMNDDAELTPIGLETTLAQLVPALRNRIEVDQYVAGEPGIDTSVLDAPIFLTGLPRSGTTYFQYLFDQDPSLRMLRTWEGERPVPPPSTDRASVRRRIRESTEKALVARQVGRSKIDAFHLTDVEGPQECLAILDQTFVNPGLLWMMSVSGYLDHLLHTADLVAAYEYHARVLKLLQWGAPPRRWALKWPCHLLALDAIAAVHPDARFVVTHRDPVQALASNCSLTNMLRAGTSPHADPHQIGRDMFELVRQHIDRLVTFDIAESATSASRLIHVDYYQLVDTPEPVMAGVFETLGLEWTTDVEESVRSWREDNPKGKRGAHEYHLEDYGLDRASVADAFAPYIERFDIPSEENIA
jgi:hypothetical protein